MQNLGVEISPLLESVGVSVIVATKGGMIVSANQDFLERTGYKLDEISGSGLGSFFRSRNNEVVEKEILLLFSEESVRKRKLEGYIKLRSGGENYVELALSAFEVSGKEEQLIATVRELHPVHHGFEYQNLHNSILQNINESVVVVKLDGTILYWNQRATEIYEYGAGEVLGKLIYQFWPEERFNQMVKYFKMGYEKLDLLDSAHIRKNGKIIQVDFHITPLLDDNDRLRGLIFVSQDVTERYKIKKALREQRNVLASLIDSQSNFLIRLSTKGLITFMNKAFFEQTEFTQFTHPTDQIDFEYLIFQDDVKKWRQFLKKAALSSKLQKLELRLKAKEKEGFIWTRWEFVTLQERHEKPNELQGVGIDITENKKIELERNNFLKEVQSLNTELQTNEEELRQNLEATLELKARIERNEQKFKSLLENSFEALVVFDAKGIMLYASPSVQSALGFAPEELIGKKGLQLVHPDDVESTKRLLEKVMGTPGKPVYILQRVRKKSNDYIYIESYSTNLLHDENVRGIVSNFRDVSHRIEAEERLINSEATLNMAQHIAKVGSVEFDLIKDISRVSSGFYAIFDYDITNKRKEDFAGFDYLHPEDVLKLKSLLPIEEEFGPIWVRNIILLPDEKIKTFESISLEYRIISAAGKLKHLKSNNRILRDSKGAPIKIIHTIQDVSEERHLERMLEDTSRMAGIGGWELNLNTKKYFLTSEVYRILELSPGEEVLLGTELKFYHSDYQVQIKEAMQNLILKGEPYDIELKMVTSKGIHIWVREVGWADKVKDKVVRVKGIMQDITERKRAEKEIKGYADRLRLATEAAGIGVWDWDLQKNKMVWDEQMRKIYNVGPGEEIGYEIWKKSIAFEDLPTLENNMVEIFKKSKSDSEFRIIGSTGEKKWIKAFSQVFYNQENKPQRMVGVNWDITRLKQAEDILRQNNEELVKINNELDHFVYSTSHNLRAPLTSILGIVGLIKNFHDPANDFKEYITLIEKSVKKLDETIQEITNYSRNARVKVASDRINFKLLIEEIVESLSFLEEADSITIHHKSPAEDFVFFSDLSRLKMIFTNLISNAIKYTDSGKASSFIEIEVEEGKKGVKIRIRDNGIGISPEYQDKVFEMFYRASTRSTGSGLGLYIVKEAVQKLQGEIKVFSEPGKGTEFFVFLPNLENKNRW